MQKYLNIILVVSLKNILNLLFIQGANMVRCLITSI